MSLGAGLVLALLSAFALNWGWLEQHGAAQRAAAAVAPRAAALAALALRQPRLAHRLRRRARRLGASTSPRSRSRRSRSCRPPPRAGSACSPRSLTVAATARAVAGGRRRRARPRAARGLARRLARRTARRRRSAALVAWLAVSAIVVGRCSAPRRPGAALGLAAGTLYAAGDVATKARRRRRRLARRRAARARRARCSVRRVAARLPARRTPLATAGTSTLLTNALPIAAGIALFHERLPGGALGALRIVAFAASSRPRRCSARQPSETTRGGDLDRRACLAEELRLVGPAGEADQRARRELAQPREERLDVPPLVEHVRGEREVEALRPTARASRAPRRAARGRCAPRSRAAGRSRPPPSRSRSPRAPRAAATSDGTPSPQPSSTTRSPRDLGQRRGERGRRRPELGPVRQELVALERLLVDQRLGRRRPQQRRARRPRRRRELREERQGRP